MGAFEVTFVVYLEQRCYVISEEFEFLWRTVYGEYQKDILDLNVPALTVTVEI